MVKQKAEKAARPATATAVAELARLRGVVDAADRALIEALARRMLAVRRIGVLKARAGLPLFQKARWQELLQARQAAGARRGLDQAFTAAVYKKIHGEALRIQRELLSRALARTEKPPKRKAR